MPKQQDRCGPVRESVRAATTSRARDPMIRVSRLFCYPVKSLRGIELKEVQLGARGIAGDRSFMVVDDTGKFITQRRKPRMVLIVPRLENDTLMLSTEGEADLVVESRGTGETRDVVVWGDTCAAVDQGDEAAAWLSRTLGMSCRLVKMADDFVRRIDPDFAVTDTDNTGFADGFPILLANESSLDDLNMRMSVPVPIERFRPNIVVSGARPFEEDSWRAIRIGNLSANVVKPCERCAITTVDIETGVTGKEPLRTLATFRRTASGGVAFGQNIIHSGPGTIAVGDEVMT